MKKTILASLIGLATIFGFTACFDDDATMSFPTWKGFQMNGNTFKAGDTVMVKAVLDKGGKYLYKVHYNWTLTIDTLGEKGSAPMAINYSIKSTTSKPIHMNDEPKAYFVIPENAVKGTANRRIEFQVDYEHAASGAPEERETVAHEGYLGTIFQYHVLSPLYSRTTSNFTTPITIE